MLSYCLKCSKTSKLKIQKLQGQKTKECFYQKLQCVMLKKFIKKQEASGLLTGLGIATPFSKIPLLGPLF